RRGEQLARRLAPQHVAAGRRVDQVGRIGLPALEFLRRQRTAETVDVRFEVPRERRFGKRESIRAAHVARSDPLFPIPHSPNLSIVFASAARCTSSGPSARRSARAPAYACARKLSWHRPSPPWICIARSITVQAMRGATILIMPIASRAA